MKRKIWGKTIALSAAFSMALSVTGAAAPLDDLQEILENQPECGGESLLRETLGVDALKEAVKENGCQYTITMGVAPETIRAMGEEGQILENGTVYTNVQLDKKLHQWLFEVGAARDGEAVLDMGLYGDETQLKFFSPQFMTGALGIKTGNLKQMYENSALKKLIGEEVEMPDIDLSTFYPEIPEEDQLVEPPFDSMEDRIQESVDELTANLQVDEMVSDDYTSYTVVCRTSDVADILQAGMDGYMDIFRSYSSDAVDLSELEDSWEEYKNALTEVQNYIGEEITTDFLVQDGRIIDVTSCLDLMDPEAEDPEDADAGTIYIDFMPGESDENYSGFSVSMSGFNEEGEYEIGLSASYSVYTWEDTEQTVLNLTALEEDEVVFSEDILTMDFDAESGAFKILFQIPDKDEPVSFTLDSSFQNIVKGKSFDWILDEVSLTAEGESAGLTGSFSVNSVPGMIKVPEETRVLLELDEPGLYSFLGEVMGKAEQWTKQFEPETEVPDVAVGGSPEPAPADEA